MRAFTTLCVLCLVACTAAPTRVDGGSASDSPSPTRRHDANLDYGDDIGPAPPHDAWIGDLAGEQWDGTRGDCAYPSGSSRVRIVLDHASGDGPRTGVVIFGEGQPPPVPPDPTRGYPPGFDIATLQTDLPFEGFAYPIVSGSQVEGVVTLTTDDFGVFEPWCELQVPVPLGDDHPGYGCLPIGEDVSEVPGRCVFQPHDGPSFPIDCDRMELCFFPRACAGTADGCAVPRGNTSSLQFTIDVSGEGWGPEGPCRLHVTRT